MDALAYNLLVACRDGDYGVVNSMFASHSASTVQQLLLSSDSKGLLPLHYASRGAHSSHTEIVSLLLSAKARVNELTRPHRESSPLTALDCCVKSRNARTLRLLLESKAFPQGASQVDAECSTPPPLVTAAEMGGSWGYRAVRHLLAHGADVNAVAPGDVSGFSPLHGAAWGGQYSSKVVDLLLEHKADPCLKLDDGRNPLYLAVSCALPSSEAVARLLQAGSDVNACCRPILVPRFLMTVLYRRVKERMIDTTVLRDFILLGADYNKVFEYDDDVSAAVRARQAGVCTALKQCDLPSVLVRLVQEYLLAPVWLAAPKKAVSPVTRQLKSTARSCAFSPRLPRQSTSRSFHQPLKALPQ